MTSQSQWQKFFADTREEHYKWFMKGIIKQRNKDKQPTSDYT